MANINKYFLIIESLHFPVIGVTQDDSFKGEKRIKVNLKILQDFIKLGPEDIAKNILEDQRFQHLCCKQQKITENADINFLYCLYSLKILLEIIKNCNFATGATNDLVSERHKSLIICSIVDVATVALQENLHASFYKEKGSIFKKTTENKTNFFCLEFLVEAFYPLVSIRDLHIGKSLDDVQLWYMASIFSLLLAADTNDYCLEQSDIENLQTKLEKLWLEYSKKLYYRNLMLLFCSLPTAQRQRIHREMLLRLWSPGGFVALLFAMEEAKRNEEQSLDETVANLVAQPNFSSKAQLSLIKQILLFIEASLKNKNFSALMGAGLLSLRKLFDNRKENRENLQKWLEQKMEPLLKVEMSKAVSMEWVDFVDLVSLMFHIFCTSSIATLPSDLLLPYLPLFLDVYSQLECHTNQYIMSSHLHLIILKILNNRSKVELKKIIQCVALKSYPKEWFQLSSNIQIKENPLNMQELKLSIVDRDASTLLVDNKIPLASLITILKNSSHNLLVYQNFLILLQLVPTLILEPIASTGNNSNIDLLVTEEDMYNKILMDFSRMYNNKIQVIKALETLVQHQPLKTLIKDNVKDLLLVLQDILLTYTKTACEDNCLTEVNSEVLSILIILIREIIENCSVNVEYLQTNLLKPLNILQSKVQNANLNYQLDCLSKIVRGEELHGSCSDGIARNEFEEARSLIESNESYLQVQGIEIMIKLLKEGDVFAVTNGHTLTALALNTLKSPESYTFLNCVRLFVALVHVNESEVLNILSDEYLNESVAMDYRLVIGEAILKTSKELGPLCYKYKNILLNTYMVGCRSALDEYRFSAFSNLSQMCRQLTYQVHHYFQELLCLIDCELTTGKYLPAKRAAVMVLSDLLAGMDNLFDYEEMLLPIYRVLKYLVASEQTDEKIRMHASNGLKCLAEKCKELFRTGLNEAQQSTGLEKEIKIMGIYDKPRSNLKSHILEIN